MMLFHAAEVVMPRTRQQTDNIYLITPLIGSQ
jgi:hypothetical protein